MESRPRKDPVSLGDGWDVDVNADRMRSNKHRHLVFADSPEWSDYRTAVLSWIENIDYRLEVEDTLGEIYKLQGRVEACRYFLQLPSIFAQLEE